MVCTDTSKEWVGSVLIQDGSVIAYESRKLKEHEKKYFAYDLELTVIIHALKMWRHYLMGKKFLLMTDHYSLTNYFKNPTLNARQARWVDFLSGFYFKIKHLKGKENWVANTLSRKVHYLYEISFSEVQTTFDELIKEAAEQDREYRHLGQKAQTTNNHEHQLGYEINSADMLIYNKILYVPSQNNIKNLILDEYHKSPYVGHPIYRKLITTL